MSSILYSIPERVLGKIKKIHDSCPRNVPGIIVPFVYSSTGRYNRLPVAAIVLPVASTVLLVATIVDYRNL